MGSFWKKKIWEVLIFMCVAKIQVKKYFKKKCMLQPDAMNTVEVKAFLHLEKWNSKKWNKTKVIDRTAKTFIHSGNVQQEKVSREVPEHRENNGLDIIKHRKPTR